MRGHQGQSCLMSLYQGQYIQGKTVPRILKLFSLFALGNTHFIYSDDMYTVNNCIRGSRARLVVQSPTPVVSMSKWPWQRY